MNNQKAILQSFLESELSKMDLQLDEKTLQIIHQQVRLVERPGDESQETRSIKIKQDSSGKFSAESIKLWNVAQVSNYELLQFIGKEMGILLFDDTVKKVIYALVMLLLEYYPKLKVEFSDQEAQVLFAIAKLDKKEFSKEELMVSFNQQFEEGLTDDRMQASLDELLRLRVLKPLGNEQYRIREKIKNLSRKN